jgi:hypothetical protein
VTRRLFTGGYDDARTELSDGWVLVEDGLIAALGARGGGEPEAGEPVELGGGEEVVRRGALVHAHEDEIAREHRAQTRRFASS